MPVGSQMPREQGVTAVPEAAPASVARSVAEEHPVAGAWVTPEGQGVTGARSVPVAWKARAGPEGWPLSAVQRVQPVPKGSGMPGRPGRRMPGWAWSW